MTTAVRASRSLPIRLYQLLISPLLPANTCKYHPTCSEYAALAIRKHGVLKGIPHGRLAPPALPPVVARRGRLPVIGFVLIASILSPLENVMKSILDFFHDTVGLPWGWSIVAVTIVVRLCLVPLAVKSIHSMQSLQAHAPEMKAIQAKYKGDRQKQSEELQKFYKENNINPAASCLPTIAQFPVFIALYFTLRHQSHNITGTWLHVVHVADRHAISHWSGYVLLVIYAGSQVASTYFMGTTMDKTQRTIMMVLPLVFLTVVSRFPTGLVLYWMTTNLWTVGPGPDHAPADAEAGLGGRAAGRSEADARAPRRAAAPADRRQRQARRACEAADERAAPRQEEEGRRAPVSPEVSVESTGETVGEAKWKALRDLERIAPGIDKTSVRYQIVSEGERGLLGVGYTPARVIAAADAPDEPEPPARTSNCRRPRRASARSSSTSSLRSAPAPASTCARRTTRSRSRASAAMPRLLIGKHGQTIDALQYVANAAVHRRGEGKPVTVDAAGYRDRRRATLEGIAIRAADRALDGERVLLEPMTAVERKVVHERLQDVAGVQTASEGTEPNRYVVVLPE